MNIKKVLSTKTLGYTFGDSNDRTYQEYLVLLQDDTTQIAYRTLERDRVNGTVSTDEFVDVCPIVEHPQPI